MSQDTSHVLISEVLQSGLITLPIGTTRTTLGAQVGDVGVYSCGCEGPVVGLGVSRGVEFEATAFEREGIRRN